MKKIDKLMIKSFLPPFLVAFGIAVFVLLMQILWVWLDDIVGKGASILVIAEMVSYMSISMFPMALPIGVLLSSVMVMGNLAEKYELVSFKSAGISLARVMAPLIIICFGIAVFSFVCSNVIIPYANLQFRSRLYDIKKKKPTLSLEQGVFNNDFDGYVIYPNELDKATNHMDKVVIYDKRRGGQGDINQIIADRGDIRPTRDNQFLVMNLYDGNHYQETANNNRKRNYPFVRTSFKSWEKVFDLREFNLNVTNKDLFKSNESMMSGPQIQEALDSLYDLLEERTFNLQKTVADYYPIYNNVEIIQDSSWLEDDKVMQQDTSAYTEKEMASIDAVKLNDSPMAQLKRSQEKGDLLSDKKRKIDSLALIKKKAFDASKFHYQAVFDSLPLYKKQTTLQTAKTRITNLQGRILNRGRSLSRTKESKTKHIYQLHLKYSSALVCLIFLFIGAPMGAIVRKGGFGYPVLIAIIFFMIYIILTLTFKKLTYSYVVLPEFGAWLPCLLMIPFGALLTYRALNDKKIMDFGQYIEQIKVFFARLINRKSTTSTDV